MDHSWFFKERIAYIRYFYSTGVKSFRTDKHNIENKLPPYGEPPYSEDGEPAFLSEWMDADTSEDVLGRACVSMLSDALKIYLNSVREQDFRFAFANKKALKKGFLRPHIVAFCSWLKVPIDDCPVSIDVLEQIVLARNQMQHGSILTTLDIDHQQDTLDRFSDPLFTDPKDQNRDENLGRRFYATKLSVTEGALWVSLDECDKLAEWIGPEIWGPSWATWGN